MSRVERGIVVNVPAPVFGSCLFFCELRVALAWVRCGGAFGPAWQKDFLYVQPTVAALVVCVAAL